MVCDGVVLVRPVQRPLQVRQMQGLAQSVEAVAVTDKLDGVPRPRHVSVGRTSVIFSAYALHQFKA